MRHLFCAVSALLLFAGCQTGGIPAARPLLVTSEPGMEAVHLFGGVINAGMVLEVDSRGVSNIVDQCTVRVIEGKVVLPDREYHRVDSVTLGSLFSSPAAKASLGRSVNSVLRFDYRIAGAWQAAVPEAEARSCVSGLTARGLLPPGRNYYLVRETISADTVAVAISDSVVSALGGTASILRAVEQDSSLRIGVDVGRGRRSADNLNLTKVFPQRVLLTYKRQRITIPRDRRFSVSLSAGRFRRAPAPATIGWRADIGYETTTLRPFGLRLRGTAARLLLVDNWASPPIFDGRDTVVWTYNDKAVIIGVGADVLIRLVPFATLLATSDLAHIRRDHLARPTVNGQYPDCTRWCSGGGKITKPAISWGVAVEAPLGALALTAEYKRQGGLDYTDVLTPNVLYGGIRLRL